MTKISVTEKRICNLEPRRIARGFPQEPVDDPAQIKGMNRARRKTAQAIFHVSSRGRKWESGALRGKSVRNYSLKAVPQWSKLL